MSAITAICIISCIFVVCLFAFFTIVYFSELKREREIRNMMLEENRRVQDLMLNGNLPVVLMDMPLKKPSTEQSEQFDKDKKDVN